MDIVHIRVPKMFFGIKINMKTLIKQLPAELWASIFSYLEAHDLLQVFTNLNTYFDESIASDHLLFNMRLGENDHNPFEYSIQSYWSDFILHRIVSRRPILQHKASHISEFLRWHCTNLIQLKSLEVTLRGREIPTICNTLKQLKSVQLLSMECVPNQHFLDAILSAPTSRVCRLDFSRSSTTIKIYSNKMSNIETLYIKIQGDSHNSIIDLLLNRMPKLKRLEITNPNDYFYNRDSLFVKSLFILSELETIKINWSSTKSDSKFFESLYQILPNLKRLSFNFVHNYCVDDVFNHLIYHWWSILKRLRRINIVIECTTSQLKVNVVHRKNYLLLTGAWRK
ncbi:unnamed protein product [Rotaria socialis]|uniref:F-box domain-containing protein n=2 Tax=Rotaria socialis TaxID=392032 RepID=A0A820S426_9BILA|nr:unnamed protein product [Rotaria socialis]